MIPLFTFVSLFVAFMGFTCLYRDIILAKCALVQSQIHTVFIEMNSILCLVMLNETLNYFRAPANDLSFNPDGSAVNPEAFQQHIRHDSNLMAQLFQVQWMAIFVNIFDIFFNFLLSSKLQVLGDFILVKFFTNQMRKLLHF